MIDKLLIPRYEVIADYPSSKYSIGDVYYYNPLLRVISPFENATDFGKYCPVELYPAIFRELKWWEKRKVKEMPEYVKCIETPDQIHFPGQYYKIIKWLDNIWGRDIDGQAVITNTNCYIPATEKEYKN